MTIHVTLASDYLGHGEVAAALTTDHAASSHGEPVAIVNGRVYGPRELRKIVDESLPVSVDGGISIADQLADYFGQIGTAAMAETEAAGRMIERWNNSVVRA